MSGFLFDSNVLLDIATADAEWLPWAEARFREAAVHGPVLVNPIIYAESGSDGTSTQILGQRYKTPSRVAELSIVRTPMPRASLHRRDQEWNYQLDSTMGVVSASYGRRRNGGYRSVPGQSSQPRA